jgi:hypothetical protein
MSYSSIAVDTPDPFFTYPNTIYAPLTKVDHISAGQTLLASTGGTLYPSQMLAPLVFASTGGIANWTLPSAATLCDIYGTQNQLQVGDIISVSCINLASSAVNIFPGVGGNAPTIAKQIPAYSSVNTMYQEIVIQWTNLPISSSGALYNLL